MIMPPGWMGPETMGRPKARFCVFLAVFWFALALIAALSIWQAPGGTEFSEIQHLAWCVLIPEPVFVLLAVYFAITEKPRKMRGHEAFDWPGPIIH